MRLLNRRSRIVKNTEYQKWYIDIPARYIEDVGWKRGQRLRAEVINNTLVFSPDEA